MRTHRLKIVQLFAALALVLMTACGKETVNIPDTTPPVVSSTTPLAGATAVAVNTAITATFSKPMNPSTLTATSFVVTGPGGASVAGTVTYAAAGSVATFTPAAALAFGGVYTATITTAATDQASPANPLAANYAWMFTTAAAPIPPTVLSTFPVNGATGVLPSQVLSATFNEAMDCATLLSPATTFSVTGPGGLTVAGATGCTTNVATFTPAAALASNASYTATITTAAESLAGTALAGNYVWQFKTGAPTAAPSVSSTVPAKRGHRRAHQPGPERRLQ